MSLSGIPRCSLALLVLGACLGAQAATASLQDDQQLVALLTKSPQCCIVDARSAPQRQQAELAGALVYNEAMRLKPTSVVVVVADTDARASAVAKTLARSSAHDVVAVKGGLAAWKVVEHELRAEAGRPGSKFSFVIPHNTCEQGTPLQIFEAKPAAPAMSKPK